MKKVTIKYKPHEAQQQFHYSGARFRYLICGRRFGKTLAGANEAIKYALTKPKSVGWVVAPTYQQSMKAWRTIMEFLPKEAISNINRGEKYIELKNKATIWFKSADRPDNLRGEGLDWAWIDEGAVISEYAWDAVIRPALADKQGDAWVTTTPKGRNWVYKEVAQAEDEQSYDVFEYSSIDNPYFPREEYETLKRKMPQHLFEQEILGKFIEDSGMVFRNIRRNVRDLPMNKPPKEGRRYVMGVDLAKHQDWTVIIILNEKGQVVYFDRFQKLDWKFQKGKIANVAKRYNAKVLIDSTGIGDPIFDDLHNIGLDVKGYKFTSGSKQNLIDNLAMQLNEQKLTFPEIPQLIHELTVFGYEVKRGHNKVIKYEAAEGFHDDCVMALALAGWEYSTESFEFILG